MTEFPELGLAAMYRIIKKSGGERVSEEAADQLRRILEKSPLRFVFRQLI
jgi:hypothetical protein